MSEATDFLYPFIEGDERGADPLLADLARSADEKWRQSVELAVATLETSAATIAEAASAMARSFAAGGQMFVFGNGGSATDADAVAHRFTSPRSGRALPARSLAADAAIVTALANDIGFDMVFARQFMAYGRAGDIALGLSTSGSSENLLRAFAEAQKRGMVTVGISGYDGGRMATSEYVAHRIVVRSESVHRIQEAQVAVTSKLWSAVQEELAVHDASGEGVHT